MEGNAQTCVMTHPETAASNGKLKELIMFNPERTSLSGEIVASSKVRRALTANKRESFFYAVPENRPGTNLKVTRKQVLTPHQ